MADVVAIHMDHSSLAFGEPVTLQRALETVKRLSEEAEMGDSEADAATLSGGLAHLPKEPVEFVLFEPTEGE